MTASVVLAVIRARVLSRVLPDQVTTPSSSRSPRWTARMASLVMVIPLSHTCTTSRGREGERAAPGLAVGDHEPGEHHRVVRAPARR